MRVDRFLEDSAARFPEKVALVDGQTRVTYAELDRRADQVAILLWQKGVRRGDRVVYFLPNSVECVVGLFGALKAGAVFCPVHPTTKAEKLAYLVKNCRARAVVTHGALLSAARAAVEEAPSVRTLLLADEEADFQLFGPDTGRAVDLPEQRGIDVDMAMLIYTSGSTGFPKGVMMTHQNVEAAATSITTYLENTAEDVILNVLPLSFDYGLYQVLMAVKCGATLILENSFIFPYVILKRLQVERVTGFPLVPTMAAILLQMKDLTPGRLPDLRYITNTAAALPPAHIERLQELFPTTRIYSMYGLTECKRCTYLPPEELLRRPGSVGIAIPNTEAYVVDERGDRVGPGVVGELVVRGAHVMKGYWEKPAETDEKLRPGPYPWEKVLYTGDLFKTDEDGFLYFVGRKDDIIKTRGEKVSPKEVENVLYALKGVREAAVVGTPDPILGMAIKALIVPAEGSGLTERDVLRHCAAHLEDITVPKQVEFRSELPKTDSGKIRRSTLQAEALSAGELAPVLAGGPE